jgi:ribonuclease BN (tRNA processing enzyme)
MGKVTVTALGTNGWFDTGTGNTICIHVAFSGGSMVLDAGNGIHRLDRYAEKEKPVYLFISHFHLDHIAGLHILPKFRDFDSFIIMGQSGTREILGRLQDSPFTKPPKDIPLDVSYVELPDESGNIPFMTQVLPMLHSDPTLGLRFEADGKTIAYCPDTGYCENAVRLARNADLLITECAYPSGFNNEAWPHLNPESAARIALESGARKLVLVHFDARNYPTREHRREAERIARESFPETYAGFDEMQIVL